MGISEKSAFITMCEEGSLMFSIIGKTLYLKGGRVHKGDRPYLVLPKVSYKVLDNIGLDQFEDRKKYNFYLFHGDDIKIDSNIGYSDKLLELEKDIFLLITADSISEAILLACIEIDHTEASDKGYSTISTPKNVFVSAKNMIYAEHMSRVYPPKSNMMSDSDRERVSGIMMQLSENLYKASSIKTVFGLILPATLFFQFSHKIKAFHYNPKIFYFELMDYINMLSWSNDWGRIDESLIHTVYLMRENILDKAEKLRVDYCIFDFEEEEGFFYQALDHLKLLTSRLDKYSADKPVGIPQECVVENDCEIEEISLEHIIISGAESEEETDTVIIQSTEKSLQVGRGSQSGNDIILGESDKTVSRVHLRIYPHKNGAFLEDLSSMGTYVDGERIKKGIKKFVTTKNIIRLGKKDCILELGDLKIQRFLENNR